MSRRIVIVVSAAAAVLVAAIWFLARPLPPTWSGGNPEALAELELGRAATQKLYYPEAVEHFQDAVKKAPGCFAAHYYLSRALAAVGQRDESRAELEVALKIDPVSLTARERTLRELAEVYKSGKLERLPVLWERFSKDFPEDAEPKRMLAQFYQGRGDSDNAIRWCEATLAVAPNDALSYNTLGYIELNRGNFAAAEGNFKRYAYIAPDQANPHDSLGELYMVQGRWDEARTELQRALQVNPRFIASWQHLGMLQAVLGDERGALDGADHALALARSDKAAQQRGRAMTEGYLAWMRLDWDALEKAVGALPRESGDYDIAFLQHTLAVQRKDFALATEIEAFLAKPPKGIPAAAVEVEIGTLAGFAQAQRLLAEGKYHEAADLAAKVDSRLGFGSIGLALRKLGVRCVLAAALAGDGNAARANEVLAGVEAVNPRFPFLVVTRTRVEQTVGH